MALRLLGRESCAEEEQLETLWVCVEQARLQEELLLVVEEEAEV